MQLLLSTDLTDVPLRTELSDDDLARAYAAPSDRAVWMRANMVCTVDGAAAGPDGLSDSINNSADHVVFDLLRALADAVVVGAGTARTEGYGPLTVAPRWRELRRRNASTDALPLVLVSNSGRVPTALQGADGVVVAVPDEVAAELATHLGPASVLACGPDQVDVSILRDRLVERGWRRLHVEGGPSLLGDVLEAGLLDELCLTVVPTIVGGEAGRIVRHTGLGVAAVPHLLLEQDGTLLGRWFTRT